MFDPCWLPSAVMQTIGALYGIFIAVFILMTQFLDNKKNQIIEGTSDQFFKQLVNSFLTFFKLLTVLVLVTELFNGLTLFVFILEYPIIVDFTLGLALSLALFILTVIYICGYTFIMLRIFLEILNMSYNFNNQIEFSEKIEKNIFRHDFLSLIVPIGVLSLVLLLMISIGYIIHT